MAFLIWITGLAGSGKTTLAKRVYQKIKSDYPNTISLDGDDFREITQQASKHTRKERLQVAMQIARMCKFLVDQNTNVICSTISLFEKIHKFNRENFNDYFEVFIDCQMSELIKRDKKKIYSSLQKNVVGIDIPFDKPKDPHLFLSPDRS
ncbi:MAG: adenylyl-sulfate kinase [Actinobacteria bacterium]|nr:adenylyl-sulfate kinase [Actinomycetota bacterium]